MQQCVYQMKFRNVNELFKKQLVKSGLDCCITLSILLCL